MALALNKKIDCTSNEASILLSKRNKNKLEHLQTILEAKRAKRKAKKLFRKLRLKNINNSTVTIENISKREQKQQLQIKLAEAFVSGLRVCIDLNYAHMMNAKEINKLVCQLGRTYGCHKKAINPFHLYFTSFHPTNPIYQACIKKHQGFQNFQIEFKSENYLNLFSREEIIYLTPDSPNILTKLDKSKVYIIGGLVDETVIKNYTYNQALEVKIDTARLPIEETLQKSDSGTFSKVLSINQVFHILITYMETSDWTLALSSGIPQRAGFIAKHNK